jgi:glycosyltransferase involved in cell wall biosynthesis
MTRILVISPFARPGGAERAIARLVRHLPRFGFDPVVALLEHGPLEDWLPDHEVLDIRPFEPLRPVATVRWIDRLRRLARRTGARAVISSKAEGHLFGGAAALTSSLPAVLWLHTMPPPRRGDRRSEPWRRYHVERVARRIPAARVICGNDRAARAQRRLPPAAPVVRIRPGLPVEAVAARRGEGESLRRSLGWTGEPVIGIVARLHPIKGHALFLRAAAILARARPGLRFVVVGGAILPAERPHAQELSRLVGRLDLADRISFAGHRDDPVPWLDALDVVVVASSAEVGPLVLGEAMALAKPVVATRVAGVEEVVCHDRSALLVPPGDARGMAAAIARILDDPALAARLGRAASERATQFCERRMTRQFAEMLDQLVH